MTEQLTESSAAGEPPTAYQKASARAFDISAPHYDSEQHTNLIARWARARSLRVLDSAFTPGQHVVELGCGTGDEALHLASRGVHVLATDASPGMIDQVSAKLERYSYLKELVTPRVLPAGRLAELEGEYQAGSLDGAYSSFGPLNCEPDLEQVARELARLVRPGGKLVISLLNKYCLWETAWYLRARKPRLASRRWGGTAKATVRPEWQDEQIDVFYWTPGEVERVYDGWFTVKARMGLTWLLPPFYLEGIVSKRPGLYRFLARWDRRLARLWPFYWLGDHVLIEFVRNSLPPPGP